jgi:hypothetical protein
VAPAEARRHSLRASAPIGRFAGQPVEAIDDLGIVVAATAASSASSCRSAHHRLTRADQWKMTKQDLCARMALSGYSSSIFTSPISNQGPL